MSETLLRCPFCGGEAQLQQIPSATWDKFVVTCKSSKCCAFYIGYCDEGLYDTRTKAVEAWNTRKPMQNIVERLEECYERYEDLEYYEHLENGRSLDFEYCHGKKDGVNEAIEIVKEEGGLNEN